MKKENEVKKIEEASISSEEKVINLDNLMKVEGGADNDDDWCIVGQCYSAGQCYTGA